jgi:hypothetical protein
MTIMSEAFRKMEEHAAFKRCASFTITHPRKPEGYAIINVAYPADGAGRLSVFVIDAFSKDNTRTCTMGTAGGYGYDKITAALRGLSVDGIEFTDHCGQDASSARLLKRARAGTPTADLLKGKNRAYEFANWTAEGPGSCFRKPGLDVLRALGYRVIQGV